MATVKTEMKIEQGEASAKIDADNYISIETWGLNLNSSTPEQLAAWFKDIEDVLATLKTEVNAK